MKMLLLALRYRMQWTGQWAIDSLQSPEQPWVGEFLAKLSEGDTEAATALYWRYEPIASGFYALQAPSLRIGGHPWMHIKYMKWLTGGNGGLLADMRATPESMPHLDAEATIHEHRDAPGRAARETAAEALAVLHRRSKPDALGVGGGAEPRERWHGASFRRRAGHSSSRTCSRSRACVWHRYHGRAPP